MARDVSIPTTDTILNFDRFSTRKFNWTTIYKNFIYFFLFCKVLIINVMPIEISLHKPLICNVFIL